MQSQVRINKVSKKVPGKLWEALVQSQARFNNFPEKISEKVLGGFGALIDRVAEKVPEKVWEALVQPLVQPGQVQQGSGESSSAWQHASERDIYIYMLK